MQHSARVRCPDAQLPNSSTFRCNVLVSYQFLQICCYVLVQSKLVQGMWAIL